MGYDMSIRSDRPVNDEALLADLSKEWDAALKVRDSFPQEARGSFQEGIDTDQHVWGGTFANADPEYAKAQAEVMRISEEMDKARVSYFRLNIWGMGRYRDTMEAVGMGYWADHPAWPDAQDFGFDNREEWWAASEALENGGDSPLTYDHGYENVTLTQDMLDRAKKGQEAMEYVKSAHPGETPGIPLVKFTSNDGWHVTPPECLSALQKFGEFLVPGYASEAAPYTWEQALQAYRTADERERKIVANNALTLQLVPNAPVGHPSLNGDDDRASVLDVITEDYFLDWLRYLEVAAQHDGFEVW